MISEFQKMIEELTTLIQNSYEQGITTEESERLAGRFLHSQLAVSNELRKTDLDSRMKKSGLKAVKAAVYMEGATKTDKKPSDVMLNAIVDMDQMVQTEQRSFDEAEVDRDALQNYLKVFHEAHLHFRNIAKGKFE